MKVAYWAGRVHISIQKILKAADRCVEAHNNLPQNAPYQDLIPQTHQPPNQLGRNRYQHGEIRKGNIREGS
eukprot:8416849-Prorocentrum_lima.AAC.1